MGTQPRRTDAMNERGLTLVGTQPRRSGAPRGVGVVETRLRHTEGVGAAAGTSVGKGEGASSEGTQPRRTDAMYETRWLTLAGTWPRQSRAPKG